MDLSDQVSLQGVAYYRYFRQNVDNGNAPNDTPCTDDNLAGLLCTGSGVSTTFGGVPITDFLNGAQYGELDLQRTSTNAYGAAVQFTDTHDVFGLKNHFVAGVAFDGAHTKFNGASYVGGLTTDSRTFIGPGIVIDEPGQNSPVSVGITTSTWGVYFADTLKLTDHLTATVSGRLNAAYVDFDRFQRRRPQRLAQLSAFQSCGRPHLRCRALADGLWWLCHGQPGADPGGAELLLGR